MSTKKEQQLEAAWLQENVIEQVPLGPFWTATVFANGQVLLQHRGTVMALEELRLYDLQDPAQVEHLAQEGRTMLGRALGLSPDGAVGADPHGLSVNGLLSDESFQFFDGTHTTIERQSQAFYSSIKDKQALFKGRG